MPHASWASTRSFGSEMATGAALGEKCAITHTRALCGCWGGGTGPRLDVGVPRSCVVAHACRAGSFRAPPAVSGVWLRSRPVAQSRRRHRRCVMAPWPLHTRYRYHWVRSCRGYLHAKSGRGLQVQCLGAISAPNVPPTEFRRYFLPPLSPKCRTGEISTRWQGSLTCPVETRAHFSNASVESV